MEGRLSLIFSVKENGKLDITVKETIILTKDERVLQEEDIVDFTKKLVTIKNNMQTIKQEIYKMVSKHLEELERIREKYNKNEK